MATERLTRRVVGFTVLVGTALVLLATAPHLPLTWDEGEYVYRAERIVAWFGLLFSPADPEGGVHALSSHAIHHYWQYVTVEEGHPSWSVVPIALGMGLLKGSVDALTASRVGPMVLFSIACAVVALRLQRRDGNIAALFVPITLLTLPRMFADAHFAALDAQLTAWWLMLWAADSSPCAGQSTGPLSPGPGTGRSVLVGALLGLTCATKFPGIFAVLPVVSSRIGAADTKRRRELLVILPVAALTFFAVNPPLWHAPAVGLFEYISRNISRPEANFFGGGPAGRPPISVTDYLFGSMRYDSGHPYPPWYNTMAWLAVVTPIPTLVLGMIGLRQTVKTGGPDERSLVLHWATLMIVRALPGAPGYDGIRLFLPMFGFWCVLAAIGAGRLWQIPGPARRRNVQRAALAGAFLAAAINLARYYPQTLSHYNLLVGGVRGASALGFEPTYWWDGLDGDVLDWLNTHTEGDEAVAFAEIRPRNVEYLRAWGSLRTQVADAKGGRFKWYVLQNRPSVLWPIDRQLIRYGTPSFTKYAGHHADGVPVDMKVPLVVVYSHDEYQRASAPPK